MSRAKRTTTWTRPDALADLATMVSLADLSHEDVALLLGYSRSQGRKWRIGRHPPLPTVHVLVKLYLNNAITLEHLRLARDAALGPTPEED